MTETVETFNLRIYNMKAYYMKLNIKLDEY